MKCAPDNGLVYHDTRAYAERLRTAQEVSNIRSTRHGEGERITVCDAHGDLLNSAVYLSDAHQLGLIHRTADILLAAPDGRILLQQRSRSDSAFAGRFAFSAGGHLLEGESPKQAAIREMAEELCLLVRDSWRLVPLHDASQGLPIFYLQYSYSDQTASLVLTKTRASAPLTATSHSGLSPTALLECLRAVGDDDPWAPPATLLDRLSLKTLVFNQEFTFYYLLRVEPQELMRIRATFSEYSQLHWVTLEELVAIAQDPARTSDALGCMLEYGFHNMLQDLLRGIEL